KEKLRAGEAAPRIVLPALPAAAHVPPVEPPTLAPLERVEEVFRALVLGTRDYVRKNGFARVVIGLSGGIDSSLVAAIAVEALGRENVAGVGMPSPYSSAGTRRDAQRVAKNLGIEYLSIPITPILRAYKRALAPATVFERAPSAELRPSQTDQDTLPPYAELDAILEGYVEEDRGVNDLVARGFAPETVRRVVLMVDRNEYKRRQAPIGVKITPRAFGRDWRLPIVNRFREQEPRRSDARGAQACLCGCPRDRTSWRADRAGTSTRTTVPPSIVSRRASPG